MPEIIGAATENHKRMMEALLLFTGLERIEYQDLGNGEDYILTNSAGKTVTLNARCQDKGGFLWVDYGQGIRCQGEIALSYQEVNS